MGRFLPWRCPAIGLCPGGLTQAATRWTIDAPGFSSPQGRGVSLWGVLTRMSTFLGLQEPEALLSL